VLDRLREAFLPIVTEVLADVPGRFPGVSADGLCAVAVSFIKGCAVQSMVDPDLDIAEFLAAVEGLLEQHTGGSSARITTRDRRSASTLAR
jgi:hypothetical protein